MPIRWLTKSYLIILLPILMILVSIFTHRTLPPKQPLPPDQPQQMVQRPMNGTIPQKELIPEPEADQLVHDFLTQHYIGLQGLSEVSLSGFYDLTTPQGIKAAQFDETVLSYIIALRKMQPRDLSMRRYTFGIIMTEQEKQTDGSLRLMLQEYSCVNFASTPNVDSYSSGIMHQFVLHQTENGYRIGSHEREEDIYLLFAEHLEVACKKAGTTPKAVSPERQWEMLQTIQNKLLIQAGKAVEHQTLLKEQYHAQPQLFAPQVVAAHPYNWEQAVAYAYEWVDQTTIKRNPNWQIYDDFGGNCNNFTSQCLFAGGIPMDISGTLGLQWKWYGDEVNGVSAKSGRSPAWSGVSEFYQYALHNQGHGLVAWVGKNPYSGKPGDVLQLGVNGQWRHSVLITKQIVDEAGNILDFLINSNTTDRIDYPASAYPYYNLRVIRILGYN